MARRGKTKVGGGPRQDTMMRAQETGRASTERAEAQQLAQIQQGGQQGVQSIQRGAAMADQKIAQDKDREQQAGQFQQKMEMEAADRGLEPVQDERTRQLQEDMDRGAKQTSKSLEYQGRGYRVSDAELASRETAAETANIKAKTTHLNAQTAMRKAIERDTGDEASKERIDKARQSMLKDRDAKIAIIDKLQTGQFSSINFDSLFADMRDNPDPAIQEMIGLGAEEIRSRPELIQRMVQFKKDEAGFAQIEALAIDGDMSGMKDRLPFMNEFRQVRDQISQFAQGNMAFADLTKAGQDLIEDLDPSDIQQGADFANQYQAFTSYDEVDKFLNKVSAQIFMQTQRMNSIWKQEAQQQEPVPGVEGPPSQEAPQPGGGDAPGAYEQDQPEPAKPGYRKRLGTNPKQLPSGRDFSNQFGTKL
jgi:hypothetical protein